MRRSNQLASIASSCKASTVSDSMRSVVHRFLVQDVVIASGCSGALDIAIAALAEEGNSILIPAPGFSLYSTLAMSRNIETRSYRCVVRCKHPVVLQYCDRRAYPFESPRRQNQDGRLTWLTSNH